MEHEDSDRFGSRPAALYSGFVRENAGSQSFTRSVTWEILRACMSVDIAKQTEQAQRLVEKGRIDDAIAVYQSVLNEAPSHLETMQSIGDLYTRQNRPDRAAIYYGMLFDRFTGPRE